MRKKKLETVIGSQGIAIQERRKAKRMTFENFSLVRACNDSGTGIITGKLLDISQNGFLMACEHPVNPCHLGGDMRIYVDMLGEKSCRNLSFRGRIIRTFENENDRLRFAVALDRPMSLEHWIPLMITANGGHVFQ